MPCDSHAQHWDLDPSFHFLNHGSYGGCPRVLLELQTEIAASIERQPVRFFQRELEGRLDEVREVLAGFVGGEPEGLALVPNATAGVNAVLRSLALEPGDELLTTDQAYNACANTLRFVAERAGAQVVIAPLPFPCSGPGAVLEPILAASSERTRLALIDHVTSPTGMVLPIEQIVSALRERGIETLVDGAHAPGMLPLELDDLGAAYYTGNCHKWLCTPKGSALLYVRADLRTQVRPLSISHGANSKRTDRSRYRLEMDWTGTADPSALLTIPAAIEFLRGLFPGGFAQLREHNHQLVVDGRAAIGEALGSPAACPESMLGSLASIPLSDASPGELQPPLFLDRLQERLYSRGFEVPVTHWPEAPSRLIRISGQAYNSPAQYEQLAAALVEELAPG